MRKMIFLSGLILLLLLFPIYGFAQDNAENHESEGTITSDSGSSDGIEESQIVKEHRTAKDNFGAIRFGGDLMFGAGRCDDKMCLGQEYGQDWNQENTAFAFSLQLEAGYLWGNKAFVGPVVTLHTGYPQFVGADLRIKLVMPLNDNNGITMSAGWGYGFRPRMKPGFQYGNYSKNDAVIDLLNGMYVPISIGFEHVLDNGLTFGITVEYRMAFNQREINTRPNSEYPILVDYNYVEYRIDPVLGFIGGGIHLGYKF